jgi:DNA-binding CsgD family transcriptional regulator
MLSASSAEEAEMPENATELRLDYKDISAGQLVIVIQGLPSSVDGPVSASAGKTRVGPVAGANANGRHAAASSPLSQEAAAIREAAGHAPALCTPLLLAAWRGRESLALELVAATIEESPAEDLARATALTDYAKAVLYNGLGRYRDAAAAARRACAQEDLGLLTRARLELVEADARSDACTDATGSLRGLQRRTRSGTDWAVGAWARSAALLSDTAAAEALYCEAIERFDRAGVVAHLSRAQLVYGEWLRRRNRRVEAREQLRAAHESFTSSGAEAFAQRARRELLATGETARRRTDDTRGDLTPQEAEIARLARDGLSNPQIGAQLFISPRTVQYHLRKVFLKLEITSRNQLGRLPATRLQSA